MNAPITAASSASSQPSFATPMITTPAVANADSPSSVAKRSRQLIRSPGGPALGSRQVMYCTARHNRTVAGTPAGLRRGNAFPILVPVVVHGITCMGEEGFRNPSELRARHAPEDG